MKLAILGSGPGGYVAAIKAAQSGAAVTVIEEQEIGGVCLNWGCIPTKALIASTELLAKSARLGDYGIELRGEILPDFPGMIARKNKIVSTQIRGIRNLFAHWGITIKKGRGALTSPHEIRITSGDGSVEKISPDKIILATGSRPFPIPSLPFDGIHILSSDDALMLSRIPGSILIVGAGVIGCEFAGIFRALGSEVTLVEKLPRAVATEDTEISEILEREFRKKKIRLLKNLQVEKTEIRDQEVHVLLSDGQEIVTEVVLVSAGRSFNTGGIGIDETGIQKGAWGEIAVNEKMETNIPGIYAVGDVIGGFMLAHVASREGITAARNATGGDFRMDYRSVPSAIFTSPEIASVGLREYQAEEQGIQFRTGHFPFRALGKSHAIGEIEGLIKVLSDKQSDKVLGVHIIGPRASDLIHEAALAVRLGLTTKDIAETIHIHPTLSEGLMEAAEDVSHEAIHLFYK